MPLDKTQHYIFRIGSDNQHQIFWDGRQWQYEFLAGGVLFDQMSCRNEEELQSAVSVHGLDLERFQLDLEKAGVKYSERIKDKLAKLTDAGILPCPKHGLISKNMDNTCEACMNTDYPDDHKGTEG